MVTPARSKAWAARHRAQSRAKIRLGHFSLLHFFISTAESALAGTAALVPAGSAQRLLIGSTSFGCPAEPAVHILTCRVRETRTGHRRQIHQFSSRVVPIRHHSGKLNGCALLIATATSDTSLRARGATGNTALCQSADAGSTPAGSTLPFLWRSSSGEKIQR